VEDTDMLEIFRYFQAGRPDVNLIYRLADDGLMLAHYPIGPISTVGTDFSFREYFQQAEETDKAFISLGRISPTTEEPVATAVQPIWQGGVFRGLVATNIKLQSLSYTLASIMSDYENNAGLEVVIIDRAGKVIANPDPSYLLTDFLSLQPELSAEVLAGNSNSYITNDQDGVETLYSFVPVPSAGWGVIVSRPTSVAFATPNSFHQGVLLMIGVFSGIGIFFWLVLSLRVLSPLEKLAAYSNQVEKRQEISSDTNLLDELSSRPDQIGHLVLSLRRMEKAIQSRFNELATLVETSQAVVSSLDSQVVLNRILEQVERLLGIQKSAIVALDKSKGVFFAKASRGLSARYAEGLIIKPDEADSVTLRAIRTGEPIIIQDTLIDPSFEPYRPRAEAEGYRSFAAIPLQSIHAAPAALVLYSPKPHLFTENNIDLLVNFANQAAMAIENAELYANSDARLQDQTRRLEALIQSLEVGLVLEDLEGKVLYVNRSVSDLVNKKNEILIGSPVMDLYKIILADSPSYQEDLSKVETLLSMEIEQDISLSIMVKSALRYYRLKGFTVNDSTGTLLGRGQILQDITKDYEIDRMKSGLISTVSHELRTPLAAIKGYATTLLADDVIWERKAQTEFIQIISDESDRLGELVNDLLDMSRIEAGNLRLSLRFCDLSEIIYRGVSRAYPHPGDQIIYDIPAELSLVRGDPQRLEVVIRNLVENAVKYADNDLPITIRVEQGEEQVVVKVEDQGPGIPLAHQRDVFQSFYRLEDGLNRRTPGVGLGLAISRGFIAAHEGEIWFEPREVGTCVAFSLPIFGDDIYDTGDLPERMEQK
jgi:signal transduction histidine kinase